MKKRFILIILVLLLGLVPFVLGACPSSYGESGDGSASPPVTALILGTDDAARNTDVILLARYQPTSGELCVMQVPRDTYFESAFATPKINHLFPALIAQGKSEKAALSEVSSMISDAFSVPIDFAVALRPAALSRLVDEIGGVSITVPMDMTYEDPEAGVSIRLKKGEQMLDGRAACEFVRYRSGYLEGDLGRVDAQKLFLSAFISQTVERMDLSHLLSLLTRPPEGLTLCADKIRLMRTAQHFYRNKSNLHAVYFSAPGEAVPPSDGGAWYYALNRDATATLLSRYFALPPGIAFDGAGRFCGKTLQFENIYFASGYPYRVFTADEVQDIIIKKKE